MTACSENKSKPLFRCGDQQLLRCAININDSDPRHAAMINRAFAQHAGRTFDLMAHDRSQV
jgi:hypothetical protein